MNIDGPDSEPDPDPDRSRRRPLRVVVTDGRGRIRRADRLRRWLADVAPPAARGEVVIALVCDRKMRDLNRTFRGVDRATDVLSFPVTSSAAPDAGIGPGDDAGGEGAEALPPDPSGGGAAHLGDVVIATGVARRQARAAGRRLGAELRCLALHGLLHLLGYDHERDNGEMERLERRLRRRGRIA